MARPAGLVPARGGRASYAERCHCCGSQGRLNPVAGDLASVVGEKLPIEAPGDLAHDADVVRRGDALRLGAGALKTVRGEQGSL